jgi:hypothetical protein
MQWNDDPNAGFCRENVKPWMDDYRITNMSGTNPRERVDAPFEDFATFVSDSK